MDSQVEQFTRELHLSSEAQKTLEERSFDEQDKKFFNLGVCPCTSSFSFDLLNGRLVVPIFDVNNFLVAFAGRRLDFYSTCVKNYFQQQSDKLNGLEKFVKWKSSKWINTPYKKADHLFNLNNAKKYIFDQNLCFVVEGYFDVMHLHKKGYKNCVALCGTSLSEKHCELLFRYCNRVVFILDGDDSGRAASYNSMKKARKNNLFASVVELPDKQDPDDLSDEQLNFIYNQVINSEEEMYIQL